MADEDVPLTQDEAQFREKLKTDWEEVRRYWEEPDGKVNPQHRLAPAYFKIYLEKRPSDLATRALGTAFTMWGNLKGVSDQVQQVLKQIPYEEDVWGDIGHCLLRAFHHDERADEGLILVEKLARKVIPLRSRTSLLSDLSRSLLDKGKIEKARQGFEQILEWNASEWHVKLAQGYIYEFDHLNIGQSAPHFRLQDIDGNAIDFADQHGKIVVLHFWGTTCGACRFIYPHLREMAQEFSGDEFVLIGISDDQDFEVLRASICEEKFTWPQICEGKGWEDTVFRLYNVTSLPSAYVIDKSGNIVCKMVGGNRGEELQEAVRSLII